MIKFILFLTFLILAYMNYRHLNIGFLSLYSIDEYAFHGSLLNMYEGLINFDIRKLFSFGFYSYGFVFFFLNLLGVAPFLASDNIEISIYIPRLITSIFAIGTLWFLYKIAREYTDRNSSILITLLVIAMPGFWRNAFWFHPDWMMVFFIVLSIYFFAKDNFEYKKLFWFAIISLAFAISVKIQAITFLPFLLVYMFYENFQQKNFKGLIGRIKTFIKSIAVVLGIFIFTNPYLAHPTGLKAFVNMFKANIESNATNHGNIGEVAISDKISNAIDFYYLDTLLFVFVLILSLITIFLVLKKDTKKTIIPLVAIYFIANIVYLFLMVNKDWQHYYLAIFTVIPLVFIFLIQKFNTYKNFILAATLIFQIATHLNEYKSVFTKGYDDNKEISNEKQNKISNELISTLKPYIDHNTNILISPYQPFDFRIIGLSYKNIFVIYGPLSLDGIDINAYVEKLNSKDLTKFRQKDFIVLSKQDIYFDSEKLVKQVNQDGFKKALEIIENLNSGGDLGYEKFKETEHFYIWRKK